MESMKERQTGIGLIYWKRQMISLKYLELGKGRKKLERLMNFSSIDNKRCEIFQDREPKRLEKVCAGK